MVESLGTRTFSAGEVIFREGDIGHEVFIIQSGMVEIARTTEDGKRVTLAFLGEGTLFGEMALVDQEPRSATATALEDSVCYVLPEERFAKDFADAPPLIQTMLRLMVQRLRLTTREVQAQRL